MKWEKLQEHHGAKGNVHSVHSVAQRWRHGWPELLDANFHLAVDARKYSRWAGVITIALPLPIHSLAVPVDSCSSTHFVLISILWVNLGKVRGLSHMNKCLYFKSISSWEANGSKTTGLRMHTKTVLGNFQYASFMTYLSNLSYLPELYIRHWMKCGQVNIMKEKGQRGQVIVYKLPFSKHVILFL